MIASHWWQGASGRWYIHRIYSIAAELQLGACNYILVRQNPDATRVPLYIGQTKDGDNRLTITRHEKFAPALRLGATELHAHFLANSRQERFDIETDLRRGHRTQLNDQPTPAPALIAGFGDPLSAPFGYGGLAAALAPPPNTTSSSDLLLRGFDPSPLARLLRR